MLAKRVAGVLMLLLGLFVLFLTLVLNIHGSLSAGENIMGLGTGLLLLIGGGYALFSKGKK
ncbi:MAG: hypothetical protein JST39_08720 [Bacteroidetes bacterium]|nr:hypothetical protein [Bacteroidota bacterium]